MFTVREESQSRNIILRHLLRKGIQHIVFHIKSPSPTVTAWALRALRKNSIAQIASIYASLKIQCYFMLPLSPNPSRTSTWGPLARPAKPAHSPLPQWSYPRPSLPLLINHPLLCHVYAWCLLLRQHVSLFISPVPRRSIYFNWLESTQGEWWKPLLASRSGEGKVLSSVWSLQEGVGSNNMGISACITYSCS